MHDLTWRKGFTLIEVIVVLLVIGIIAVIVVSRITSISEIDLKVKAEQVKGHIRYAQMLAMNTTSVTESCESPVGMAASENKYYIFKDCAINNKVILPGAENSDGVDLPAGSTFPTFSFDSWGRPHQNDDGTGESSSINLSIGGEPITVTKNTGYVP